MISIIEIIINFFRPYKSFDDNLIKSTKQIFFNYVKNFFLIDLIEAFPYFSLFDFLEKKNILKSQKIYILLMFKSIKIFTIKDNNAKNYILESLLKIEAIEDNINTVNIIFIFISVLNITTCLFIFLGRNYYPSWIIKLNIQDEPYIDIYLASLYFVIVTITTVGYGDITGNAIPEIAFQMILLILGTIAYSFIISYFSNYIVKINQKSINLEQKVNILNEIKFQNPNMKDSLYNEVLRNIRKEDFYEKKDKQLLFQCLPYSLKNKLIMEMYKPIIKHFDFFKGVDNSDFVVKVSTSLRPLISVKGNILIHIGDFVKEIFFIKKGIIELCICIDLNDLEYSINNYFDLIKNENEKLGENTKSTFVKQKEKKTTIDTNLDAYFLNNKEQSNYNDNSQNKDINIGEIKAKQHLGESLMFLNRQSPFKAIIGTRSAELLILKKMEAIEIYSVYPNIWKRINKKSLYNMDQMYYKIRKTLIELSNKYNIKISKNNLKYPKIIKNGKQNSNNFESVIKNEIKNKMITKKEKVENKEIRKKMNNNKIKNKSDLKNNFISPNLTFKDTEEENINNKNSLNMESKESITSSHIKDTNNDCYKQKNCKSNNENSSNNLSENMYMSFSKADNLNNSENKDDLNKGINKDSFIINKENIEKKDLREFIEGKKINNLNEKTNNNRFLNLSPITESSFQLNSSYENINKISHYKYINNLDLQKKAKHFIVNECMSTIKVNHEKKDSNVNDINTNKINNSIIKSKNSIKGDNLYDNKTSLSSEISSPKNQKKRICKAFSVLNMPKEKINNIINQNKNKKKIVKKASLMGKRLNAITKNIQNAKEQISHPNEFYVNLFNNIIEKESAINIGQAHNDDKKTKNMSKFVNNRSSAANEDNQLLFKNDKIESKFSENNT